MSPAEEALFEFEKLVDKGMRSLPVWRLPLRSVLSALFLSVDGLINRGDIETAGATPVPLFHNVYARDWRKR
jgi:hypothetical protein